MSNVQSSRFGFYFWGVCPCGSRATDELKHIASRHQRPRGRRRPVAIFFWCRSTG